MKSKFHERQIFIKLYKKDLLVNIFKSVKRTFDIHFKCKDIVNVINLQGKLEPRPY